jgi:predicted O-methyltransferase YrrM
MSEANLLKFVKRAAGGIKRRLVQTTRPPADAVRKIIKEKNDAFFAAAGVDQAAVRARYAQIASDIGIKSDQNQSLHFLLFTAVAATGFKPKTILEIGTLHGDAAVFLATLFPEATIYTVELPADDPLLARWHNDFGKRDQAIAERFRAYPNIRQLRINSFDLMASELPVHDLVWLDGGHHFPEVAWDHAYAIGRLSPGGWFFSDDLIHPEAATDTDFAPSVTMKYIRDRKNWPGGEVFKRENPDRYHATPKFIAWLHRPPTQ